MDKKIIGMINGLYPSPGAYFSFKGERYKILKAEIGNGVGKIGEVISDTLEIACNNKQSVKVLEIQRQGKKPQKIGEFMLGSKIKKGLIISFGKYLDFKTFNFTRLILKIFATVSIN